MELSGEGSTRDQNDYVEGEKILSYHGALIYEAKILKITENEVTKKKSYLIHYQGWNDRYDEWVDASRIMKFSEENKKLQEELKAEVMKNSDNKIKRSRKELVSSTDGKTKKRKVDQTVVDPKYKLDIQQNLKQKLVDDWENITIHKYLISLPRKPSVADILNSYQEQVIIETVNPVSLAEKKGVIAGIREYFEKALGTLLLYRFERHQYSEIYISNKGLSEIYGVEHLLRLIVKLPQLLATVEMEDAALNIIKSTINDLLKYISNNINNYPTPYEPATPEYIRLAS